MTYLNNNILTFFGLLSGVLLVLLFPLWLTYLLLASLAVISLAYAYHAFPETITLAAQFCTEFMGFCLMLTVFVGFTMGMGLLFA